MKIKKVMKTEIHAIGPEATLKEAVAKLFEYNISGLIVVDQQNKPVGVVSEKDIYKTLYPSYNDFYNHPESFTKTEKQEKVIQENADLPVKNFMTSEVIKVRPDDPVMKVGALMLAHNIHRLPVVDDDGNLVGVVSRGSIYRNLFRKYLNS